MKVVYFRDAKLVTSKVNVADASISLKPFFIFTDPETALHLKLIIGQEHPSVFGHKLESMTNVVDIFIIEVIAEVQARVPHFDDL